MYYSQLLFLVGLIVLSAFFSASETALISLSKSKVDDLVTRKLPNSKLLRKLKQNPHRLLITVLVGNNIVNIGASAYAAVLFTKIFDNNGLGIATGVMTFLILIFGEITPKAFAHQHAATFSLLVARPIYFLQIIFFPLIWLFDKVVILANKMIGGKTGFTVTEGEIVAMLKIGAQEGTIEKHERELIENVLEFNDIEVEDVMTPRVNVEALDCEMTIQEAVEYVIRHSHTRLPIYKGNIDNIIGIVSVKELLRCYDHYSVNKKLKGIKFTSPLEVPLSKKINKLFREFQRRHLHMAVVIDEYGGTAGLVTLEDLLEEIVGEIVDEFDVPEVPIEVIDEDTIVAKGSTLIEDINDCLRIKFATDEHETINTFLTDFLHRFPREGEVVKFERAKVLVLKMKKNVVDKIKITRVIKKKEKSKK